MLAPVLHTAGLVAPIPLLDGTVGHLTGLLLAITGIVATLVAQHSMGASWRVGVDHRETTPLITHGAFALARNPVFTAMIIAACGFILMAPNILACTALVVLVTAIEIQVRIVEEPYLATHGQTYRTYATRTGRFLPGLGRLNTPGISSTQPR